MLPFLTSREASLDRWYPNGLPPSWMTVADVLGRRAEAQPDRTAFAFVGADGSVDELSYRTLDRMARAVAVALGQRTIPGKRVLLSLTPGRGYLAALYGCLRAGAIAVPCSPPSPRRRTAALHAVALDSQAGILITDRTVRDVVLASLDVATIPGGLRVLLIEDVDESLADEFREPFPPTHIALLQYTSGSTGAPKGVLVGNDNLLANARSIAEQTGWNAQTVLTGWCPPYHDLGLVGGVLGPVIVGFPSYHINPIQFLLEPRSWLETITRYRGTIGGGPNFAYDLCVDRIPPESREGLDLSSWTCAITAAETPRPRTMKRFSAAFEPYGFRRGAFQPSYGMAEASLFITGGGRHPRPVVRSFDGERLARGTAVPVPPDTCGARPVVGCGTSAPRHVIRIVDPMTAQPLPERHVGEVWFKGPSVTHGYWHNPAATEAAFRACLANGEGLYLRTGDLGFLHDEELFVIGRIKDLIIIRGRKHVPDDIEHTCRQSHPALRADCVAFSVDVEGEERLAVAQEIDVAHPAFEVDEVVAAIRAAVANEHDINVQVVALLPATAIPKTTSGKLQRSACRARLLTGTIPTVALWELSTVDSPYGAAEVPAPGSMATPSVERIENWLVERLARAVGTEPAELDAERPFAEFGLDSVAGVRIVADLSVLLGTALPAALIWEHPTVARLAEHLAQGGAA
jgi:phthiocerol/phenolphthiocerol synthesis type-I polyketide synthase C